MTLTVQHAVVDSPLRGEGSRFQMATVTAGDYSGEEVVVLCEFADGACIVARGDDGTGDKGMAEVHIDDLRLWVRVRSVTTAGGKLVCAPV